MNPWLLYIPATMLEIQLTWNGGQVWFCEAHFNENWYLGVPAPSQDASHKWRFRLGFPTQNGIIRIILVMTWLLLGGGYIVPNDTSLSVCMWILDRFAHDLPCHVHQSDPPNEVSNMTNESAGISYVVGAPERQGCAFRVWENLSNKQNTFRTETKISLLSTIPRDPINFWEWKNLNTMLRRWLDTRIIFSAYDWMPMILVFDVLVSFFTFFSSLFILSDCLAPLRQ